MTGVRVVTGGGIGSTMTAVAAVRIGGGMRCRRAGLSVVRVMPVVAVACVVGVVCGVHRDFPVLVVSGTRENIYPLGVLSKVGFGPM